MIEAAFWLSAACAVAGAFTGNRTAWLLLASVGLCIAFEAADVPFNFVVWLLIDLVVILGIIRPHMTKADCVILALFIPAWIAYLVPDPTRFTLTSAVVIAQLAMCFPMRAALRRAKETPLPPSRHDDFDLPKIAA